MFLDTSSLRRRDKDTMWPIYQRLHGECQIVGEVRVRVADDGSLWLPGLKAAGTPGVLLSEGAKAENLEEVTGVKEIIMVPEIEKKESPATDEYHELRRLVENEREGSPIHDMDNIEREKSGAACCIQGNQNGRQVWVGGL
ncbi:hypothetical protein [Thiolapillus sp.]|uniref:hypothetical protein n=1 Tax=Thiolapillus sp. TaxID=2017437 RepID=UPI003AF65765